MKAPPITESPPGCGTGGRSKSFEDGRCGIGETDDSGYDELDAEEDAFAFADLHRDTPITTADCLTIAAVAMERMTEGFFGEPVQYGEHIARVLFACLARAGVTLTVQQRPPQRPRPAPAASSLQFIDWDTFWTTER